MTARRRAREKEVEKTSGTDRIELRSDIVEFSRLESELATAELAPRPISRDGQHVMRHAGPEDIGVNELDYDYEIDIDEYPTAMIDSTQELWSGVLYHQHLSKPENFSNETSVECFSVQASGLEWLKLDESALKTLVDDASNRWNNVSALSTSVTSVVDSSPETISRKALIFFIPLIPTPDAPFKWAVPMTRSSVKDLFSPLSLNPAFLLNMLGRPDYWAPQSRWDQEDTDLLGYDFFCQHPRWNLQNQGAPLSVYSKHDVQRDLTVYIISHNQNDATVRALRLLLNNAVRHRAQYHMSNVLLESPFDLHVMISNLNFEVSKKHVERFRRFQWDVVNKVDDHLAGLESSDRSKLKDLTKKLQIVSQNADSHMINAEVFLFTAHGIQDMIKRSNVGKTSRMRQRTLDAISFAVASMQKQREWFKNYKARKDSTMRLVFNLVTQQDALNNIELGLDMKKDSTSMNAIAALTMVFLPGTFTASVLSAGIFQSEPGMTSFRVTGLWWLWVVTTVPITIFTVLCWSYYKKQKERKALPGVRVEDEKEVET